MISLRPVIETVVGKSNICCAKGRQPCLRPLRCFCISACYWCGQVTETEREDLEESEKVQFWVERLCQTRLEQISSVENDSPEVTVQTG